MIPFSPRGQVPLLITDVAQQEVLSNGWESFSIFEILNQYVADELRCIEFLLSLVREDLLVPHEGKVSKLDRSGSLEARR